MAAMADCHYVCDQRLEDDAVVHRLLPPEILVEIGIPDHAHAADARRERSTCSHALVEELAARLVGILGLTSAAGDGGMGEKRCAAPASGATATPYGHPHAHRPHVRREQHLAGGGGGGSNGGMVRYHAPVFGMEQWPPTPTPTFVMLPPPRPTFVAPPASFAGTGVFLPRAEVYPTRPSNPPRINGEKPPRLLRKEATMETIRNRISS